MAYRFDHQWQAERERLGAIEAVFDPGTRRAIESTGALAGRRCLEVGGGGGSVAAWLCERVGAAGRVVATDLETGFLEALDLPNLEVRRHDVVSDPLEDAAFDLIHARAVVEHLPERDAIVAKLAGALAPGGWLVLEAGDFTPVRAVQAAPEDAAFFDDAFARMIAVADSLGMSHDYGCVLGTRLRATGLEGVVLEGMVVEWDAAHPLAALYRLTFERLREAALVSARIDAGELDRLQELMAAPGFRALSHAVYSARGRRPVA